MVPPDCTATWGLALAIVLGLMFLSFVVGIALRSQPSDSTWIGVPREEPRWDADDDE